jgi:hypothetical protein
MAATAELLRHAAVSNNVTEMRRLIAAGVDKDAFPQGRVIKFLASLAVCVI